MTTQKQLTANQNNASRSTGPRTRKGKSMSSRNALKHGLTAADFVLPGESSAEFKQLRQQVSRHYEPVGPIEEACANHIAVVAWRLRRVSRFETALLSFEMLQAQLQDTETAMDLFRNPPEQNFLSEHASLERKILYQRMRTHFGTTACQDPLTLVDLPTSVFRRALGILETVRFGT